MSIEEFREIGIEDPWYSRIQRFSEISSWVSIIGGFTILILNQFWPVPYLFAWLFFFLSVIGFFKILRVVTVKAELTEAKASTLQADETVVKSNN